MYTKQEYIYSNPVENKISRVTRSLNDFIDTQELASVILLIAIIIAIFLYNVPYFSDQYLSTIFTRLTVTVGEQSFSMTIRQLIDNFLLVLFFFVLGLEVKREVLFGAFSDAKRVCLVMVCAIGGIFAPISVYLIFNSGDNLALKGWAIPIATDTALAVGVLYLLKNKLSREIFGFVATVAVIDDVFTVFVIAIFYTKQIHYYSLLLGLLPIIISLGVKGLGIRNPILYLICGMLSWFYIEHSGVHPTIVGIAMAFVIPTKPKKSPSYAVHQVKKMVNKFEQCHDKQQHILQSEKPHHCLEEVENIAAQATVPLKRWENKLETPILLLVLPLFALCNGGFLLDASSINSALHSKLFWSILLSLAVAKPFGIYSCATLFRKLSGNRQQFMSKYELRLVSIVCGIGYTMSLFISELAFGENEYINTAKCAIFFSALTTLTIYIAFFLVPLNRNRSFTNE